MIVTLKDGSKKEYAEAKSVIDIAYDISEGLARAACAGEVNGEVVDLRTVIDSDCELNILTAKDEKGLAVLRHTASHVLAQAVQTLFPDAKVAIGPSIDTGFYYDFDCPPFSRDDLDAIEKEMKKIIKKGAKIERFTKSREDAIAYFQEKNEPYKVELIEDLPEGSEISFYSQGDWTDLCAGPHLMSVKGVKAFKLLSSSSAYWRGSEKNAMLTRIYGTAYASKDELKEHLEQMEEAKRRDHNKLGREMKIFNGGVYGLPVSQTFPMLFYRSDILAEMGVDPEKDLTTWEGLMNVLPVLQRNYMEVGLILPVMGGTSGVTTISPVTEAGNTFAMLLLQQGVNYYNDEKTKTNFDTQEAVNAFDQWTEFYTKYSFSQTYDAFTRFRQGDMPVLIQNYTFFNQLSVAAPEIKGCWDFMHVPGTENENGSVTLADGRKISIASCSTGSGAIIFTSCPDKEGAWEFIKWFTSDETQVAYGNDIESVLGTMGRYDTANLNALQQLSWTTKQCEKLTEQLKAQVEIPVIPASYGVTRNLNNAFREVANQYENARDTLFWYNKDINEEIERKNNDLKMYEDEIN